MFSLLLVTTLVGVARGQLGLQSASIGFGSVGGLGYGNNRYGYGSGYGAGYGAGYGSSQGSLYGSGYGSGYNSGYGSQSLFSNQYGGFPTTYLRGRASPFSPFTHRSVSPIDSPQTGSFLRTSYRNPLIPQTYEYQQYQRYNSPDYPNFAPITQAPLTTPIPYYTVPYFESVETYKFYNSSKALNKTQPGLNLDSKTELSDNNNKNNESLESGNSDKLVKEDPSLEVGPVLQLTYLGYVPQSSFRSVSQLGMADEAQPRIPFYILDYEDETSGSPRSSSGSPTVYIPPNRLHPTSEVHSGFPTRNTVYTRPSWSPVGPISPGIPSYRFSSLNPDHVGLALPEASPYRLPFYRSAPSDNHPGYYLIDVKPVARDNAGLFNGPMLGVPRPTIPSSLIQTLTGPMGGPIGRLLRPVSTGVNINTQAQTGIYKGGENVNQHEKQHFNTGYETQRPNEQVYSNFQSEKEVSVQKYDGREEQGYNSGFNSHAFGTPGVLAG